MSDRARDQLVDDLLELAADDMPVGKVLSAADQLYDRGIRASHVRALRAAGLTITFGKGQPRLPDPRSWSLTISRWPQECRRCGNEIRRGELAALGRLPDNAWAVECHSCHRVDPASQQAERARRFALERETDDPEQLVEAILALTPAELREEVEDDLTLRLAASENEEHGATQRR